MIPPRVQGVHWIASAIPLVLIGYALNEFDAVLAGYLADSYLSFAASGFAALSLVRSTLSASFPLFPTHMFNGLGAKIAASVLAAVATVFCIIPPLFSRYGRRIRGGVVNLPGIVCRFIRRTVSTKTSTSRGLTRKKTKQGV